MTERRYASRLIAATPEDRSWVAGARAHCLGSFIDFLEYWQFKNRETGAVQPLGELWAGQRQLAELMQREPRIYALKAGKLGFTELECAFDAWRLLQTPNARVHLFSRDASAAHELLAIVRFGLQHLPDWLGLPVAGDLPDADTASSLKLRAGPDDVRTLRSYATGRYVSIDQTAMHVHIDELAHMQFARDLWASVQSTIAPDGSCHIVTRGAGNDTFAAELWEQAEESSSSIATCFTPYTERPGRDPSWREREGATLAPHQLRHFAPETVEDAMAGDATSEFLPQEVWQRLYDPNLPALLPGDRVPVVVGVDAGVSRDGFAVVVVGRHPDDHKRPAIRACKVWTPEQFPSGRIDFDVPERFIRFLCEGGCANQHPPSKPDPNCGACRAGAFTAAGLRVVQVAYDVHQIHQMMQSLSREHVTWTKAFDQGRARLVADSQFQMWALRGELAYGPDCEAMADHIANARAETAPREDSKIRIVKRSPNRRIDLAVAASMAIDRVMYLNI